MVKAVLFDMDGTLIDTEKYYRIFWPMALKQFGCFMILIWIIIKSGHTVAKSWRSIWKRWVLSLSPVQLRYLHI